MNLIKISDVIIPEYRIRREFDPEALQDLSSSIEAKGLMHPIVLRSDQKTLVAGERRLRAISDLDFMSASYNYNGELVPPGFIPFSTLEDLSPLDHEEAELEENIKRQDLTWQEEAQARARLADLRVRQAESKGEPKPSLKEITKSLDLAEGSATDVNQQIVVSKHLADPEVSKAQNIKEAYRIVRKKQKAQYNADMAARVGVAFGAASHSIINGDSLAWMKDCPDSVFDVILTDPPYGMGADEFGDKGKHTDGAHKYEDSRENFMQIMSALINEAARITKPQAHFYWFCDIDAFFAIRTFLEDNDWRVFRTPLIWHKPSNYTAPWPDKGPQRRYECILFASKGDKLVQKMAGDVLTFASDDNLGHMAQKPVALFEELLKRSCIAGDKVLDPFCGTGPIFPAAHDLKVSATGIEMDPSSYGIAVTRIKELK